IERIEALSLRAQTHLKELNMTNVVFGVGDGTLGWPEKAPFDAILVTAGCPAVPETLCDQLADGGRLVIPVGDRFSQTLRRIVKSNGILKSQNFTPCRFVDLIGRYGWPD
ncbi:MAG: protein-L-isoaspartate O-methyltransferase, partial [Desulfomonilaceae bacterium]